MKKSRLSEEKIFAVLKQAKAEKLGQLRIR